MKSSRSRSTPADAPQEALQTALRFLAYRPRSEAEVKEYLKRKGFTTTQAAVTLDKLRSLRYADDGNFARQWARGRAENRGYGPRRIARELSAKGIDPLLVGEAIRETFGAIDERENARLALKKRFRNEDLADPRILRRAAAFLQRRGYSETVIISLLQPHEE